MVVSALIGAGPTVGRVGEFGAFSRLFGGNLVSVSIDLEFVVNKSISQIPGKTASKMPESYGARARGALAL